MPWDWHRTAAPGGPLNRLNGSAPVPMLWASPSGRRRADPDPVFTRVSTPGPAWKRQGLLELHFQRPRFRSITLEPKGKLGLGLANRKEQGGARKRSTEKDHRSAGGGLSATRGVPWCLLGMVCLFLLPSGQDGKGATQQHT